MEETSSGGKKTKLSLRQLQAKYEGCPQQNAETEVEGKKYLVARHFTQEKDLAQMVSRLAQERADRETGASFA